MMRIALGRLPDPDDYLPVKLSESEPIEIPVVPQEVIEVPLIHNLGQIPIDPISY